MKTLLISLITFSAISASAYVNPLKAEDIATLEVINATYDACKQKKEEILQSFTKRSVIITNVTGCEQSNNGQWKSFITVFKY